MVAKKSNTTTETMQASTNSIQTKGLKYDKTIINRTLKANDHVQNKQDLINLLESVDGDNTFLLSIIDKTDIEFNNTNDEIVKSVLANVEKVYKNLKNKKNNITDINDDKLYVTTEEKKDEEEELLTQLFDQNKITSVRVLSDLIDGTTLINDRKKSSLKKKISLYPTSINTRSKNAVIKFVKKEYKLYQLSGINDNKIKKIFLFDYLNTEYNNLNPRFKNLIRTNAYTNEQRLKEFTTTSHSFEDESEYKELKNVITKRLSKVKHVPGMPLREFLQSKLKMNENEVKTYFKLERIINLDLSKTVDRKVDDSELLNSLQLNDVENELFSKYMTFLKEKMTKRQEKFDKIEENKHAKDSSYQVKEYNFKFDMTAQDVINYMLTYEKFILDVDSCDFLAKIVNYTTYDMLKSSIDNLIELNSNTSKPKKIVNLDHLKNNNSSLFTLLYKNTPTYLQLCKGSLDVSNTNNDTNSVKSEEEADDVETENVDESTQQTQESKNRKYKTTVTHIKELLNCNSKYSDYKFNKNLISVCSSIVDDVLVKISECLKSYYCHDFNGSKLVQKKVTFNSIRIILDIIFINNNIPIAEIDTLYDTLDKKFGDYVREDISA